MADNTTLNSGSGGDVIRTDEIGTVKVPVSKIMLGGDGLDLGFVSGSNPFPVISMTGSVTGLLLGGVAASNANPIPISDAGGSLTVDGSVTHVSGSVTGLLLGGVAASNANPIPISDAGGSLTVDGSITHASGSVTGLLVGGVAVANSNPVPVSAQSGSQTGILVGANPIAISNPVPIATAAHGASTILSGSTYITVYHAFSDASTSGSANQIIAPQGGNKRIAVLALEAMCLSATNIRFVSTGSAGTITNITNKMYLPANGGVVLPHNPHAWFKTVANEGLNIDLSAANTVGVTLTWTIFNN